MRYKSNIRVVVPAMPTYRAINNITDNKIGAAENRNVLAMRSNEV
jgi:hypothetical protein